VPNWTAVGQLIGDRFKPLAVGAGFADTKNIIDEDIKREQQGLPPTTATQALYRLATEGMKPENYLAPFTFKYNKPAEPIDSSSNKRNRGNQ
jgi:hypothetical protein